jgi:DNA-binding NarL/FixJ family response regulator
MRCLLIDDDIHSRELAERILKHLGHRVTSVSSGTAAVAALGSDRFDVALVDLEMPGMSGSETLRALRETDPRMRLLVVSGADDRRHVLEAVMSGADGYIVKDEMPSRLREALQDVVAGKSPLSSGPANFLVKAVTGKLPPSTRGTPPGGTPRLADKSGELIIGSVKLEKPTKE